MIIGEGYTCQDCKKLYKSVVWFRKHTIKKHKREPYGMEMLPLVKWKGLKKC